MCSSLMLWFLCLSQASFLSLGPKFHFQTEVEPFSNIELYNLMCGTNPTKHGICVYL